MLSVSPEAITQAYCQIIDGKAHIDCPGNDLRGHGHRQGEMFEETREQTSAVQRLIGQRVIIHPTQAVRSLINCGIFYVKTHLFSPTEQQRDDPHNQHTFKVGAQD